MATPSDPRGGPPQVRPPAQPRKPASSVLQQRAFAALILAIISLLGLPGVGGNIRRGAVVLAVTMIIGAVGLWLSFTAMSRSRKEGTRASAPNPVVVVDREVHHGWDASRGAERVVD